MLFNFAASQETVRTTTDTVVVETENLLVPQGVTGEHYFAPFDKIITLDGKLEDWTGIPKVDVASGPTTPPNNTSSFIFAATADADNFYYLADVQDSEAVTGTHDTEYWNEDTVEFYLNISDNIEAKEYGDGIMQFWIPRLNAEQGDTTCVTGGNNNTLGDHITCAVAEKEDGSGYVVEVAVPLEVPEANWSLKPEHGYTIGFQAQLNSASEKARDTKLIWSTYDTDDQSWQNPSLFGSLVFYNLGETTMPTLSERQSRKDPLANAEKRIEFYRKGNLRLNVTDAEGQPLEGATVQVQQQQHQFFFGSNLFRLDPDDTSQQQGDYQARFKDIFNFGTLPFYWGSFERVQNEPDYERLDKMVQWGQENDITLKGHPLVWQLVYPDWAPKDADGAKPLLEARINDIISRYKGVIDTWDVINEVNSPDAAPDTGVADWIHRDGASSVVETALGWARDAGGETLLYNDFQLGGTAYANLLEALNERGTMPDAIGLQSHMHGGTWSKEQIWETCQKYSTYDLPLHFTEMTIISGDFRAISANMTPSSSWPSTSEGEARQAEDVETVYTVLYSCPAVQAITWWDLSDGGAWLAAPSGLLYDDMTPKPAYERLLSLIKEKWWTDVTGVTDSSGSYSTRATLGGYEATVTVENKTVTQTFEVTDNGDAETVVEIQLEP
ncbi:MAG: endo-1,4-beta-xylanase [Trueperaceae bacterium]